MIRKIRFLKKESNAITNDSKVISLRFKKGEQIQYKEVVGFFLFNYNIYYKQKDRTGKNIITNKNFSDDVSDVYNIKEIGKINVIPLSIIK